jgi:hypothetical protein
LMYTEESAVALGSARDAEVLLFDLG